MSAFTRQQVFAMSAAELNGRVLVRIYAPTVMDDLGTPIWRWYWASPELLKYLQLTQPIQGPTPHPIICKMPTDDINVAQAYADREGYTGSHTDPDELTREAFLHGDTNWTPES
jgi:hypothetical protein